jgi:glutathione S-transferase
MILVGQYDSPYVRRVAVSLRTLGFAHEHDTRSVFADFDAMRAVNRSAASRRWCSTTARC